MLIKKDSAGGEQEVGLVYSPADDCNCQQHCDQIKVTGCHVLNATFTGNTTSFRFQNSGDGEGACLNKKQKPGDNC